MADREVIELLEKVRKGELSPADAAAQLKHLTYCDLGFACPDHHRSFRWGFPEVIFCQGKEPAETAAIFSHLVQRHERVLATRADEETARAVLAAVPEATYHRRARCLTYLRNSESLYSHSVLVVTAGTADLPVAEEAVVSAQAMGLPVRTLYDVGVAGLHRLLDRVSLLQEASVIIVVAGMEGALASVVAGLTSRPIVAVPTSVGYGANFRGLSALLTMLNSCATGIGVVNIDNGFGAAALAHAIISTMEEKK